MNCGITSVAPVRTRRLDLSRLYCGGDRHRLSVFSPTRTLPPDRQLSRGPHAHALSLDRYRDPRNDACREPGDRRSGKPDAAVGRRGPQRAAEAVASVDRGLTRSAVELLENVRAGAEREGEWPAGLA